MPYNNYITFYSDVEEAEFEEPDKELRTERLIIRLTPSVKREVKQAAQSFHMTVSSYVRMKLFAEFVGTAQQTSRSKAEKLKDVKKKVAATPERVAMVQELQFVFSAKVRIGEDGEIHALKPSEVKTATFKELDVKDLAQKERESRRKILEKEDLLHPPCAPPEE